VSVGVQSFDPGELRWLGRRHDPREAEQALGCLRAAGFDELGIDLVQGLPGQSLASRLASLDRALAFEPEHLSLYELTVEPDTPLARDVAAGRCELPDSDQARDLRARREMRLRALRGFELRPGARPPIPAQRQVLGPSAVSRTRAVRAFVRRARPLA